MFKYKKWHLSAFTKNGTTMGYYKAGSIFEFYLKYTLLMTACLLQFETMAAYSQYVWAKKGLILRTQPSKTGEKIKTLPYGTKVDYLEQYIVNDSVLIIVGGQAVKAALANPVQSLRSE